MEVIETDIEDVLILEPRVYGDHRGFFLESWNVETFRQIGLDLRFMQDNHSRSDKGVLRGLHYQRPEPQGKLVRVSAGRVFDVVVDLRRSSATYGHWIGNELSDENKRMVWVPEGMAHGFLVLEDRTDFLYKCTGRYNPQVEHTLLWNDPDIGIEWPHDGIEVKLSEKDRRGRGLAETEGFA